MIAGPTASGKSALALALARHWACAIVSADSRQVYSELEIGVARPHPTELAAVRHHLVAYVSIHDPYSAAQWAQDSRACLESELAAAHRRGVARPTCIIAGGSGLHVRALLEGLPPMPSVEPVVRERLGHRLTTEGLPALVRELEGVDPAYAALVDRDNPARVLRALAAIEASGSTFTALRARPRVPLPYSVEHVILEPERAALFDRIDARVDDMMARGLAGEATALYPHRALPALQTIGYQEWWPYVEGRADLAATAAEIKRASRAYARRQTTWLRRQEGLRLPAPDPEAVIARLGE